MKKARIIFCLLVITTASILSQHNEFPKLTDPYPAQKPLGNLTEIFAQDVVSTIKNEENSVLSKDGAEYYSSCFDPVTKYQILNWKNFSQDSLNPQTNLEEIKSIVYFLADDNKLGRKNGSAESFIVSNWIKEYFESRGLESFNNNYFQNYSYINAIGDTIRERNVIGFLKSPDFNDQNYLIVSAHFDHLGTISGEVDSIYNGANDNATGVALILSLIQELKQIEKRSYNVIFAAFSGEENGLEGSGYFAKNLPVPREKIQLTLNFDMVGRTGNSPPYMYSITGYNYTNLKDVIMDFNKNENWKLEQDTTSYNNFLFMLSDNYSFVKTSGNDTIKIPAHTFKTDAAESPNYHTPQDEAHLIDYENLSNFSGYIYRLIDFIGNNKIEIKWVKEIVYEFDFESEDGKFKIII